jgi:RHS repeat-associated protein
MHLSLLPLALAVTLAAPSPSPDDPPATVGPIVTLAGTFISATTEPSQCLTIGLRPGVAYECGGLRVAYPLPTITTLNTPRTPTLVYRSTHATPAPIVRAWVTRPSGTPVPSTVTVKLRLSGDQEVATHTYAGSAWSSTAPQQVASTFDAHLANLPTGLYAAVLSVQFDGGFPVSVSTDLPIVNRRSSPFGPGWWLAGYEQLFPITGAPNDRFWVGGDGSTRRYAHVSTLGDGTRVLVATARVERVDTLRLAPNGTAQRHLPLGARVHFSAGGHHLRTVSATGWTTHFDTDTTTGQLRSLWAPAPGSSGLGDLTNGRWWSFTYTGGQLASVWASGPAGSGGRTIGVATSGDATTFNESALGTPASITVSGLTNWSSSSITDRRGTVTTVRYASARLLDSVHTAPGAGAAPITHVFQPAESRAISAAVGPSDAETRWTNPRRYVTRVAISPLGAPTRITDALNRVTTVAYNSVFLGLPDSTTAPNLYTTRATYDARGNAVELRAAPVAGLFSTAAITTVQYHPVWDLPTQITSPVGVVETRTYQSTQPLLQSVRTGPTTERQQIFSYCTAGDPCPSGLLKSIARRDQVTWQQVWHPCPDGAITCEESMVPDSIAITTPGAVLQTVTYGALGNAIATETNGGKKQEMERDAIGRITRRRELVGLNATQTAWRVTLDSLDLRDLVTTRRTFQEFGTGDTLRVWTTYDAAGAPTAVHRQSRPDHNGIGILTDLTVYDAAGRVIAQRGPGRDSTVTGFARTFYDQNGNADSVRTARGHVIRMQYDPLDRLTQRVLPPVDYASRSNIGLSAVENQGLPRTPYPDTTTGWGLSAANGQRIEGDTETFSYDPATGELETAFNAAAQITRRYYANGWLRTDSTSIATASGGNHTLHRYGLTHTYDAAGNRTMLRTPAGEYHYRYEPAHGDVVGLRNPLGDSLTVFPDTMGLPAAVGINGTRALFIREHSLDGDLTRELVTASGSAALSWPATSGWVLNTTLQRTVDGKLRSSVRNGWLGVTSTTAYAGLGHVVESAFTAVGVNALGQQVSDQTVTLPSLDALANPRVKSTSVATSTLGGSTAHAFQYSFSQGQAAWWYRADSSGRLHANRPGGSGPATTYEYDLAGNTTVATNPWVHSWNGAESYAANDRVRYYDAANRLRVTEARTSWPPSNNQYYQILIERDEARHDALGRRVWYEVRRRCFQDSPAAFDCRRSYAQRTVWDGDREVWEVRAPTASEFVTLPPYTAGLAERDSLLPEFPTHPLGNFHLDPNPFFGAVGYGYLGGVDQPVTVERFYYADKFRPNFVEVWAPATAQPIWRPGPFTIFPHWNAQGQADLGVVRDGGRQFCSGGRCTAALTWPALKSPFDPGANLRFGWMGSLLEDKRDADGTLYRRHRYLDPQSGRFTQPDPIGIAGGLNLYGYANGDPVNYSDPFGLCPAIPQLCTAALGAAAGAGGQVLFNYLNGRPISQDVGQAALSGGIMGLTLGAAAPAAAGGFAARIATLGARSGAGAGAGVAAGVAGGLTGRIVGALERAGPQLDARVDAVLGQVPGSLTKFMRTASDGTVIIQGGSGSNLREIILNTDGSSVVRAFDAGRNAWNVVKHITPR